MSCYSITLMQESFPVSQAGIMPAYPLVRPCRPGPRGITAGRQNVLRLNFLSDSCRPDRPGESRIRLLILSVFFTPRQISRHCPSARSPAARPLVRCRCARAALCACAAAELEMAWYLLIFKQPRAGRPGMVQNPDWLDAERHTHPAKRTGSHPGTVWLYLIWCLPSLQREKEQGK
jgi:hypothetical protein